MQQIPAQLPLAVRKKNVKDCQTFPGFSVGAMLAIPLTDSVSCLFAVVIVVSRHVYAHFIPFHFDSLLNVAGSVEMLGI